MNFKRSSQFVSFFLILLFNSFQNVIRFAAVAGCVHHFSNFTEGHVLLQEGRQYFVCALYLRTTFSFRFFSFWCCYSLPPLFLGLHLFVSSTFSGNFICTNIKSSSNYTLREGERERKEMKRKQQKAHTKPTSTSKYNAICFSFFEISDFVTPSSCYRSLCLLCYNANGTSWTTRSKKVSFSFQMCRHNHHSRVTKIIHLLLLLMLIVVTCYFTTHTHTIAMARFSCLCLSCARLLHCFSITL